MLQAYEDKTGGSVLAIAHNGNLSNGMMFPTIDPFTGKPLTREYAQTRASWEPLYEVTQIKGDGEAHPFLSPNDELAGYELWDKGNLNLSVVKKPEMLQGEYARTRAADRPAARAEARHQPLQVRHDRLDRQPHRARHRRGGQLLRQARRRRAEPRARMEHAFGATATNCILGWQQVGFGLCRACGRPRTRARRSWTR